MRFRETKNYKMLAGLLVMAWSLLGALPTHAGTPTMKTTVRLIVTNAQGTVVATMTPQGQVTYTAAYRPYGEQIQGTPQAGPGYTGHVNDPNTGLVYMQQRYYDPVMKRFISPDPISPTPGNIYNINRYVYAANNPIRYTDPDGRCIDGVTCGSMLSQHVEWRMSHPNAPPDGLEKAAFTGVGVMASAKGGSETASVVSLVRAVARYVVQKVAKPKVKQGLPNKPDDLLKQGYKETSHPGAAQAGHRSFENPKTGDKIRFDQGKPGKSGHEGKDHYHRYNPDATGKQNQYIDKNGNPCARGCDASHLYPGD